MVLLPPPCADIKTGWGMSVDSQNLTTYVAANPCPANTYGVANKTNGLINMPCKACTKNLVSTAASDSFDDCKNPGGFGYTSEGANQCPDNFWAAASLMQPCEPCSEGRITSYKPGTGSWQDSREKCRVPPGHGVYNRSSNDPWSPANPTAATPVRPCPIGFYSAGDTGADGTVTTNPACQACSADTSTPAPGSATCDGAWPPCPVLQRPPAVRHACQGPGMVA